MFSIVDGARLVDSSMSTTHIWFAILDLTLDFVRWTMGNSLRHESDYVIHFQVSWHNSFLNVFVNKLSP